MNQMSREDVRERLGNIDQIRDVIFGTQLREYENRFSKLESDMSLLHQEMRSHVEQLKANFSTELKSAVEVLDKKLKSVSLTSQEDAVDLRQQVDRLNRKFSNSVQSLDETLDTQTTSIRDEVFQTKVKLQEDITGLRELILEELDKRFSELRESKVSKDDMAETLFALGMRIKEAEFIPQLREAADENREYGSLPLLETTKLSKVLTHVNGSVEIHS
ncbi:MAG: gp58-like family protein [Cyanomargarita calcarea GSE-NOS-MK-12-04C]|jgi:DNA anti-recombination protein RmuC|uniref:Gp58-like family protein n=1 Tax=Cyanomargarita calcarea GSE-NOS-MK-12-04C TaxID=2839659 RepID=A0A951QTW6_9CYAN|nr:gp58-like family protein [Cyanomargarita calcarea GSE-NOS-MK-12-04C]